MLHVAPEPVLKLQLRRRELLDYVSADLHPNKGDIRMDITDIQFEDETFDVIYCSHVLEHIADDRRAMSELARVLTKSGWAIIQVPVIREITDEDPTVTDPQERQRRYGQFDHVRAYGKDYADRLASSGFEVRVDDYSSRLGAAETERYGLMRGEDIYFCTKAR